MEKEKDTSRAVCRGCGRYDIIDDQTNRLCFFCSYGLTVVGVIIKGVLVPLKRLEIGPNKLSKSQ